MQINISEGKELKDDVITRDVYLMLYQIFNIKIRYMKINISEGKELKDDVISRETSSLTKTQAAAVKKRVDTLNATLRKKQKQKEKHKADVRDIFTPSQVTLL